MEILFCCLIAKKIGMKSLALPPVLLRKGHAQMTLNSDWGLSSDYPTKAH